MQGSGSETGNMNVPSVETGFEGLNPQAQKLLVQILRDEKASATLKTMARDLLNRNGIGISDTDGPITQEPKLQGLAPLDPVPLSKKNQLQLQMLEAAQHRIPMAADSEMMSQFLPTETITTPSYYPQHPMANMDSLEDFRRFSIETLFFTFYFQEGTVAQQMAAEVLRENFWSFHTKYLLWFKRLKEPDVHELDFEMGTYAYFDTDQWEERTKTGFMFEYKYLDSRYPS